MKSFLTSSALFASAWAHGGVIGFTINGQDVPGFKSYNDPAGQNTVQRPWATFDPIQDPSSPDVICNKPGNAQPSAYPVAAGSKVTAKWNDYTHNIGPLVFWMTECPNNSCANWDGKNAKWFKVLERGLISGNVPNGLWGSGEMINNGKKYDFTIPKNLKSGEYLLRTEVIAMHSQPAQFYPQCSQLKITGSGTATPPDSARAAIPGVYSLNDPIWAKAVWDRESETSVRVPGPAVWGGEGGSYTPPSAPVTPSKPSTPATPPQAPPKPTAPAVQPAPAPVKDDSDGSSGTTSPAPTYGDDSSEYTGDDDLEEEAGGDDDEEEGSEESGDEEGNDDDWEEDEHAGHGSSPAPAQPAQPVPTTLIPVPIPSVGPSIPAPAPQAPPSSGNGASPDALKAALKQVAQNCTGKEKQTIVKLICTLVKFPGVL